MSEAAPVHPAVPVAVVPALVSVLATLAPALGQPVPDVREGDVVLLGGHVFTGLSDRNEPNPGILVRDGTLLHLGVEAGSAETARRRGATVFELGEGETVLPGFVDLHAHYAVDLFGRGKGGRVRGESGPRELFRSVEGRLGPESEEEAAWWKA